MTDLLAHLNPHLWIETRSALGGIWVTVGWPHLKHFRLDRRILALLILYIGAPMLSAFAIVFFIYDWIWPARPRPLTGNDPPE